ncbi:hypothetical protein [Rhodovibrio salinarum]|uniref:Uncharacterized protein n=1 Tax=Rhodovibrio salinarum TaxID=1087 RepID=A0A934UYT3_9PROT|nr:hypothetical protein [Rhodovibrio salinarum]MBK1695650.1 hypothetical protein [Rhodovibrio salinarum]
MSDGNFDDGPGSIGLENLFDDPGNPDYVLPGLMAGTNGLVTVDTEVHGRWFGGQAGISLAMGHDYTGILGSDPVKRGSTLVVTASDDLTTFLDYDVLSSLTLDWDHDTESRDRLAAGFFVVRLHDQLSVQNRHDVRSVAAFIADELLPVVQRRGDRLVWFEGLERMMPDLSQRNHLPWFLDALDKLGRATGAATMSTTTDPLLMDAGHWAYRAHIHDRPDPSDAEKVGVMEGPDSTVTGPVAHERVLHRTDHGSLYVTG